MATAPSSVRTSSIRQPAGPAWRTAEGAPPACRVRLEPVDGDLDRRSSAVRSHATHHLWWAGSTAWTPTSVPRRAPGVAVGGQQGPTGREAVGADLRAELVVQPGAHRRRCHLQQHLPDLADRQTRASAPTGAAQLRPAAASRWHGRRHVGPHRARRPTRAARRRPGRTRARRRRGGPGRRGRPRGEHDRPGGRRRGRSSRAPTGAGGRRAAAPGDRRDAVRGRRASPRRRGDRTARRRRRDRTSSPGTCALWARAGAGRPRRGRRRSPRTGRRRGRAHRRRSRRTGPRPRPASRRARHADTSGSLACSSRPG
jgi:hypothetical protein